MIEETVTTTHHIVISCDAPRCKGTFEGSATSIEDVVSQAFREGWFIRGVPPFCIAHCPACNDLLRG